MKNKIYIFSSILLIVLSFCLCMVFSPFLPPRIASHGNALGQVDGYSSKFWGIFLFPILMLVSFVSLKIFEKLDPKAENIKKFETSFNSAILAFNVFFFSVFLFVLSGNMGIQLSINKTMALLFAFLLYNTGNLMKASKQNYFIGIRTPGTFHSEIVGDKTHRLGSRFFYFMTGLCLVGLVYPNLLWLFILVPLMVFVPGTFIYSYLEFKKL